MLNKINFYINCHHFTLYVHMQVLKKTMPRETSNLHDLAGEVLKAEWRLGQQYRRRKRKYCKCNLDYWQEKDNIV